MAVFLAVVGQVEPVLPVQVIRDSKVLDVDGDGVGAIRDGSGKGFASEIDREPASFLVRHDKACFQTSNV